MTKTAETLKLEKALELRSRKRREYGCTEVTIGFEKGGHGDEIVDYMSLDSTDVFRCFEIKVSLADLKSDNKKSWYGNYNYLVVSDALYHQNPAWGNYIPPYVGILCGENLTAKRNAKEKKISDEQKSMLKGSLIRSVFWKMEEYKDADNQDVLKELRRNLSEKEEEFAAYKLETERRQWISEDYECYYRRNHQDESFSLEHQAKRERQEYALRKKNLFSWKKEGEKWICPNCGYESSDEQPGNYCSHCGSDLRKLI